jgi:hypothetical protein
MPHSRIIVLISGWAGSGKDAAATLLEEELNFQRHAFADVLKADVSAYTGIPLMNFHSLCRKDAQLGTPCDLYPNASTPRDILLTHAAAAREKDPDVFCRRIADLIASSEGLRFVISDWRLLREHEFLQQRFPRASIVALRITRTVIAPRLESIEHELDEFPFDIRIANDGCISDLRDALRHALRLYLF